MQMRGPTMKASSDCRLPISQGKFTVRIGTRSARRRRFCGRSRSRTTSHTFRNRAFREAPTFHLGDLVYFCGYLDDGYSFSPQEPYPTGNPIHIGQANPKWIAIFGGMEKGYWDAAKTRYEVAKAIDVYRYPTQRPEIDFYAFAPPASRQGAAISNLRECKGK